MHWSQSRGRKEFWYDKKLRRRQEQNEQKNNLGDTLVTEYNSSREIKKKDNSEIVYYNCNKKGHIFQNYFKPQKYHTIKT